MTQQQELNIEQPHLLWRVEQQLTATSVFAVATSAGDSTGATAIALNICASQPVTTRTNIALSIC